jgi:hypothetical protein
MLKGLIVTGPDCVGPDFAGSDSVGSDCAGAGSYLYPLPQTGPGQVECVL